ncbi:universal stress protein [Winogradskyella thalassocola]|uniref:Nucleotide-binding universal stress protein, UspA family n=1 Tax=Winogradskyella thalassocola TaxID=262004 RepID=A0A1G7YQ26_9FLAO|nr:universal stress protein [Winogradskyella thalassocola]SDG98406.1 Nucleotide-binding universal stress protein, UspA family [Winogradskyella thalassocola]
MPKNILLPTDFSDNALSAAIYAIKLYDKEQCTFHFLHSSVIKVSLMSSMSNKLIRVMAENARKDLTELKAKFEKNYANENHSFEVILSTNDLHSSIEAIAEKIDIDLIIIGTKGETKAQEIIFGSNTVNVIKHAKKCPVLVIPNDYDFVIPEQIAFPTDFNRVYGDELQPLKQLAELHNSKIRILHINSEDDISEAQKQNLTLLEIALENYNPSFHWMTNYNKKAKAIQDFTEDLNINILVMVNYNHSFIENIIKEPIIKNIGFQPTIPFLVIPRK